MSAQRRKATAETRGARPNRPKVRPAPTPDHYPALCALVSGYLHQDFVVEHKTAGRALTAFVKDANATERRAARQEWQGFVDATADLPWPRVREAFCAMGGAWRPPSRAALTTAFAALVDGKSSRGVRGGAPFR